VCRAGGIAALVVGDLCRLVAHVHEAPEPRLGRELLGHVRVRVLQRLLDEAAGPRELLGVLRVLQVREAVREITGLLVDPHLVLPFDDGSHERLGALVDRRADDVVEPLRRGLGVQRHLLVEPGEVDVAAVLLLLLALLLLLPRVAGEELAHLLQRLALLAERGREAAQVRPRAALTLALALRSLRGTFAACLSLSHRCHVVLLTVPRSRPRSRACAAARPAW
jgi:hypothetical protein